MSPAQKSCDNVSYYQNGLGMWQGAFTFRVTSWKLLWLSGIGSINWFLVLSMASVTWLFGKARIFSQLTPSPDGSGVVGNEVRITKIGITLYLLREKYELNPDCRQVHVRSKERFGPVPFLFNVVKEHPAEVLDNGLRAVYFIPLLGTEWVGDYRVSMDKNEIRSVLTCRWGEAKEEITRVRI
jgi:hypothetical protein